MHCSNNTVFEQDCHFHVNTTRYIAVQHMGVVQLSGCDPPSPLAYTGCIGFWRDLPAPSLAYAGFNSVEVMSVFVCFCVLQMTFPLCSKKKKKKITSALVWDHSNFKREKNNTQKKIRREKKRRKHVILFFRFLCVC